MEQPGAAVFCFPKLAGPMIDGDFGYPEFLLPCQSRYVAVAAAKNLNGFHNGFFIAL